MCRTRSKTQISDQIANGKVTNKVMDRAMFPDFIQKLMEYEEWIIDEQKKAEQILRDGGYKIPRTRARINIWPKDFRKYLKMTNKNKRNNENEACYAVIGLTKRKVRFRSNSSRYSISSPSIDKYKNSSILIKIARAINNFYAKQKADTTCKQKKMSETVAEKTQKSRGNREHRMKQRKKKLKKGNKQRRNQIVKKNKPQLGNFNLTGANEWFHAAGSDAEESALLAQVMALSQQEFLKFINEEVIEGAK
ncbi:unnamed protein product [Onchocerca ochengi]|uniref:Uncharacterized protein n=1 Tax=Onchocerca ochengi TaxID=42157 RepID=A0A182EH73_ONCOC|nr:unnamed protein product [Onchocerca ochengi]